MRFRAYYGRRAAEEGLRNAAELEEKIGYVLCIYV
jgi:hypothetical protein